MSGQRIHRISGLFMVALPLTALLTVLSGYGVSFDPLAIHTQPPLPDEGTQAHLFQISIVALAPAILLFLPTHDPTHIPMWRAIAVALCAYCALSWACLATGGRRALLRWPLLMGLVLAGHRMAGVLYVLGAGRIARTHPGLTTER